MGVGTDDGTYYADDREYHAEQAKKLSDAAEMKANDTSGDFISRFGGAEQHPLVYITNPRGNVEDRTNDSVAKTAVHYIADSLNPSSLADLGQAYTSKNYFGNLGMAATSRMPQVETPMSDELGYKSIPQYQQPVDKTVTDADINQGINLGMAFSGGGLGTKDMSKYIDMFVKSPGAKEEFTNFIKQTHGAFQDKLESIYKGFSKEAKELPADAPVDPISKGYIQPAYRGLTIYHGGEANPVYDFGKNNETMAGNLYSSNSPMLADMYAGYLNQHPGWTVPPGTFSEGAQVMPLRINTKDYHYYDAEGGHWTDHNSKAIKEAKKLGKPGVVVDRVVDEPNSTKTMPPKTVFITFPEGAGTVKSKFAQKFDPSSPNMMHAIGVAGPLGAVSMQDTSEQSQQ